MDLLLTLVAFALVILVLAGPFLAIGALRRSHRLEREVARLRARLDRIALSGEAHAPEDAAQESSARPVATPPPPVESARPAAPPTRPAAVESDDDARHEPPKRPARLVALAPVEPEAPRKPIEWERWIGVRGAALLGGVLFALAAVFLYMHAVEQQWITPRSRVLSGTTLGLVLVAASELLRRKSFRIAPGAIAAAGVVALYASGWAANSLYALIGDAPALAAFAATTALCVGLAVRHESEAVALLGLLGGFATPVLLSMQGGDPTGLFGYLFLLNAGLLVVGRRKGWASIGLLGVAATALLEAIWVLRYASDEELLVGMVSLAALAALFIAAKPRLPDGSRALALVARGAAVLPPLLLAIHFAASARFEVSLWTLGAYGAVLQLGAIVLARRQGEPSIAIAGAAILAAIVGAWAFGADVTGDIAVQLCTVSALLGVGFGVLARFEGGVASRWPGFVLQLGLLVALLHVSIPWNERDVDFPWSWLAAAVALSGASLFGHRDLGILRSLGTLVAGALVAVALGMRFDPGSPQDRVVVSALAVLASISVGFAIAGFLGARGGDRGRLFAGAAASVAPLLFFAEDLIRAEWPYYPASMTVIGLSVAALAARAKSGWLLALAVVLAAVSVSGYWGLSLSMGGKEGQFADLAVLLTICASLVAFVSWPAWFRSRFAATTWAWRASALAALLLYPTLPVFGADLLGRSWSLFLPTGVAVALVATERLGAARLDAATVNRRGASVPRIASAWLLGMAAPFLAFAAFRWSEGPWPFAWLSFTGALLAIVACWTRHAGVALWSITALVFAALALVISGGEPTYHANEPFLWNRMTFDGLFVAACAGFALWLYRATSRDTAESDGRVWTRIHPAFSIGSTLVLAVAVFQWINLTVFERWSAGEYVLIETNHLPARDLTLSSSWIVYGLLWLGVGMWKQLSAARWLSLAVLLLSLAKVFLFDLAHLEGLYRVASLFGLGLSLVLVSLLYQRFVFRDQSARNP